MRWRECALLALPGLALAGPPATPATAAPVSAAATPARSTPAPARAPTPASAAADADLLEFLGSVDSSEPGWHEYLEHTDLEKVIHAPSKPATPPEQGKRT